MPKIRGVKPEFWTDDAVVELSPFARLLFLGMWNFACDNGHLADKPRQIKMRILPADSVDMEDLITELVDLDLVDRAGGWITVVNLCRHQKIDWRYFTTCDKPGCVNPHADEAEARRAKGGKSGNSRTSPTGDTAGTRRAPTVHTVGTHVDGDGDGDGDGETEANASVGGAQQAAAPPQPRSKRGTRLPEDWEPPTELRDKLQAECPHVDQWAQFLRFKDYWDSQPGQKGVKANWEATYRLWIRRAADDTPRTRTTEATGTQRARQAIQAGLDLERMIADGDQGNRAIAR